MRAPGSICLGVLALSSLLYTSGCRPGQLRDNVASRISFLRWNAQSNTPTPCSSRYARALELASLSPFELNNLMESQPAPDLSELHGRWHGINKGTGAAAIGLTQDIKVFDLYGTCPRGHNVSVYQVGLKDLDCRGFDPQKNLRGEEKTMGNFVIVPPRTSCQPLKLDYTQGDNPITDPSRRLIDEIVMIDSQTLLGKAHLKVGSRLIPVAFFVLVRAPSSACDACD